MLQADVWDLAVVDDGRFVGGDADDDALHLIGIEVVLLDQDLEGVERRLNRRADGPLLDVGPRDLVALAELVDEHRRIVLRHERGEKVVRARQNVVDGRSTRFDEQGRGDAVLGRHAAEVERFLDVIGVALPCGET